MRVLGPDLRGKGEAFLAGLEWAVERGVQVMNLSLSSKSERLFSFFHETVDWYLNGKKGPQPTV